MDENWFETFDAVFFITVISLITGSVALAFKFCLRSKCSNFSCCWGLLDIRRDTSIELNDINSSSLDDIQNPSIERI